MVLILVGSTAPWADTANGADGADDTNCADGADDTNCADGAVLAGSTKRFCLPRELEDAAGFLVRDPLGALGFGGDLVFLLVFSESIKVDERVELLLPVTVEEGAVLFLGWIGSSEP